MESRVSLKDRLRRTRSAIFSFGSQVLPSHIICTKQACTDQTETIYRQARQISLLPRATQPAPVLHLRAPVHPQACGTGAPICLLPIAAQHRPRGALGRQQPGPRTASRSQAGPKHPTTASVQRLAYRAPSRSPSCSCSSSSSPCLRQKKQ